MHHSEHTADFISNMKEMEARLEHASEEEKRILTPSYYNISASVDGYLSDLMDIADNDIEAKNAFMALYPEFKIYKRLNKEMLEIAERYSIAI